MSKRLDERHSRILTGLLKLAENKKCFDCPSKVNVYANLFNSTFICEKCSGLHRELNHRVKSISASTFTPEEVSSLQKGGNAAAKKIWLATWSWREYPEPDAHEVDEVRQFMRAKYIKKLWYQDPNGNSIPSPVTLPPSTQSTPAPAPATVAQSSANSNMTHSSHNGGPAVPDRVRDITKNHSADNLNYQSLASPTGAGERILSRKSSTLSSDSGSTTFSKSTDPSSAGSSPFNPAGTKQQQQQQHSSPSYSQQQYQQQQQQQPARPQPSAGSFDDFMGRMTGSGSTTSPNTTANSGSILGGQTYATTPTAIASADPFSLMTNAFSTMDMNHQNNIGNSSSGNQLSQQQHHQFSTANSRTMPVSQASSLSLSSNDIFSAFSATPNSTVTSYSTSDATLTTNDPFSLSSLSTSSSTFHHNLSSSNSNGYNPQLPASSASLGGAKSFDDYLLTLNHNQGQQQQAAPVSSSPFYNSPPTMSSPSFISFSTTIASSSALPNPFGLQASSHQQQQQQQSPVMQTMQRAFTADFPASVPVPNPTTLSSGATSNPFATFAKQTTAVAPTPASPFHNPFGQQQQQQQQTLDYFSGPGMNSQPSKSPNPFMATTTSSPSAESPFGLSQQQQQLLQSHYQQQQMPLNAFTRSTPDSASQGYPSNLAGVSNNNHNNNLVNGQYNLGYNQPFNNSSTFESAFSVQSTPTRSMTAPAPPSSSSNMNHMFGQWLHPTPTTASSKYPAIDDLDPFSTSAASNHNNNNTNSGSSSGNNSFANAFSLNM